MFDIVGRRGWWYLLSTVLLVPGVVALLTGGLKPGIDFTGGTLLQVRVAAETTQEDVTVGRARDRIPRSRGADGRRERRPAPRPRDRRR